MHGMRLLMCAKYVIAILIFVILVITAAPPKGNRRKIVIVVLVCFCFAVIYSFVPLENLVVTFPTASHVYYYTTVTGEVVDTIDGQASSLVVAQKRDGVFSYSLIPKDDGGYKIPTFRTTIKIAEVINEYGSFSIYQIADTNDYYFVGLCVSDQDELQVTDCLNSQFRCILDTPEELNLETQTYIMTAYLCELPENYFLTVNGNDISIFSDSMG